jgi:hypothetical protein
MTVFQPGTSNIRGEIHGSSQWTSGSAAGPRTAIEASKQPRQNKKAQTGPLLVFS